MKQIFLMLSLFSGFFQACNSQNKHLDVGDPAPSFTLQDQHDSLFRSSDFVGKKILVIYFYPKDESLVCTKEACSFRDYNEEFLKAGALIIGINSGSVESHRKFQENHQLPFLLLSDPGDRVSRMFGVRRKFFIPGRETFVVDKSGKIVFRYSSMTNGPKHEQEALDFVKKMGLQQ